MHGAQQHFRTTSKRENLLQNGDAMQKKSKMHAMSMTPHVRFMRGQ
jgi:hypothetical protein